MLRFLQCKLEDVPEAKKANVAVIGGGPAGLAATGKLICLGYNVTLFDMMPEAGGLLLFGIPPSRLPKDGVRAGVSELREAGVEFKLGVKVGKQISLEDIISEFDAILIATGTWRTRRLSIPGSNLDGVYGALEYIVEFHKMVLGHGGNPPPLGDKVIVVGGGLTAVDACLVAQEAGVSEIHLVYRRTRHEAPAGPKEFEKLESMGVKIHELVSPVAYVGENNRVKAVKLVRMKLVGKDESGRPKPVPIPGSEFILETNSVLEAVGLKPTPPFDPNQNHGIRLNRDGTIWTDEFYRTSRRKVFAAGDVKHGPSRIGLAFKSGLDAAVCIHKFLSGEIKGWST